LLASATEIVCALGAENMLIGRSHECDNPRRGAPAQNGHWQWIDSTNPGATK